MFTFSSCLPDDNSRNAHTPLYQKYTKKGVGFYAGPDVEWTGNNPEKTADGDEKLAQDLLAHCQDGLARYKYHRWFNFVDDLPKTATGKIQRYKSRR